jgi:hypothetical protein
MSKYGRAPLTAPFRQEGDIIIDAKLQRHVMNKQYHAILCRHLIAPKLLITIVITNMQSVQRAIPLSHHRRPLYNPAPICRQHHQLSPSSPYPSPLKILIGIGS